MEKTSGDMGGGAPSRAGLSWRAGVPVSARFDDPYYSLEDGLAETRHVFLRGNDLPERFADGFAIAELGFGTGLNLLAAWEAWVKSGARGRLHYTSFELYPLRVADLRAALAPFAELADKAEALAALLAGGAVAGRLGPVAFTLVVGDARATVPRWQGAADAWFLDGFAPARNPELWEAELLGAVAAHTRQGGSFATYSAAGAVRRGLAAAGFRVTRCDGFGRKRHMLRGGL